VIDRDYYEFDYDHDAARGERRARPAAAPRHKRADSAVVVEPAEADEALPGGFTMSYQPSRHERLWLYDALRGHIVHGEILDVLRMVKGGKEACVYLCEAGPALGAPLVAAKVYRPRQFRTIRNDALYRQGRRVLSADGKEMRDGRAMHAIRKGTDRGKELSHASWMAHEFATLERLHAAGIHVPRPITMGSNAILMGYVGDAERAAPTLDQVALAQDQADALFRRLMDDVERMLALRIVHGDLSAFNVLYWEGDVKLIDFPQVVDPFENQAARALLERDVARLCKHFARFGVASDAAAIAERLWQDHVPADLWLELRPEFVAAAWEEGEEGDRRHDERRATSPARTPVKRAQ